MAFISGLSDIQSMYKSYSGSLSKLSMKNSAMTNTSNQSDGMFGMSDVVKGMDSIKNGYYKKLYSGETTEDTKTSDDTAKKSVSLKGAAQSLKSSSSALMDSALYEKDKDGNLDRDSITKKVESFVSDYNTMLDKTADSTDLKVLQKGVVMTNSTATSMGLLKRIGISINSDNTLSLDKDKLKTAQAYELKAAFSDRNSYMSKIEQKATQVSYMVGSGSATYSSTGTPSYSYSSIFNMNKKA